MSTFGSMTSLRGKVGMSLVGLVVDQITETECNTNVRDLRRDTTSSVEDSVVSGTSKGLLFKRRQDVSNNTLKENYNKSSVNHVNLFANTCNNMFLSLHTL